MNLSAPFRALILFLVLLAAIITAGLTLSGYLGPMSAAQPILIAAALILISFSGDRQLHRIPRWLLRVAAVCALLTLVTTAGFTIFAMIGLTCLVAAHLMWIVALRSGQPTGR